MKPEFFRHEWLYQSECDEGLPLRVAFSGLWTAADREGRFRWAPRALKLDCLPYDDVDFSRVLHALWTRGFIEKYEVENQLLGFIPSWHDHQAINNRERPSELPKPNESNILTCGERVSNASATRHDLAQGEGKGREGKGNKDAAHPPPNGGMEDSREVESTPSDPDAQLYARGKEVLGKTASGLITQLKKHFQGSVAKTRAAIETASTKENAREYVGGIIHGKRGDEVDKSNWVAGNWDPGL